MLHCFLAIPLAASQTEEADLLEVVADIGRAAADEAAELIAVEGQGLVVGDAQGSLAVVEHSLEGAGGGSGY